MNCCRSAIANHARLHAMETGVKVVKDWLSVERA